MERNYTPRRSTPGSVNRRTPVKRGRNNRRGGLPPFVPLLILAVVLILVVVLIVFLVKGCSSKDPSDTSSANSSQSNISAVSTPTETSSQTSSLAPVSSTETPPPNKVPTGNPEKMDSLIRLGDTGYEYYNFVKETANQYITMVSDAGKELKGSATLYNMVIPTSIDIMLPEGYKEEHDINSQDQRKAIEDYIYPSIEAMNPDVKTVSIFDALRLHSDEYIYYRTDHHWTQLGAYYAYVEFCKERGFEPVALDKFEKKEYSGFLGSFYRDSGQSAEMAANPDTVEAYLSSANASLSYTTSEGESIENWPVIQDGSTYDPEWLYLIFIAGDQPYEEITNSDITDGSSCVVVKESFGNAFVPFLVNHYQTIYVVDYRHYQGDISDLVKEKGAKDVILLNNISMTRNADLVETISSRF